MSRLCRLLAIEGGVRGRCPDALCCGRAPRFLGRCSSPDDGPRSTRVVPRVLFAALAPLDPTRAVFGQYSGYRRDAGVVGSTTETFAAVQAEVRTWRWSGVSFFLRTAAANALPGPEGWSLNHGE